MKCNACEPDALARGPHRETAAPSTSPGAAWLHGAAVLALCLHLPLAQAQLRLEQPRVQWRYFGETVPGGLQTLNAEWLIDLAIGGSQGRADLAAGESAASTSSTDDLIGWTSQTSIGFVLRNTGAVSLQVPTFQWRVAADLGWFVVDSQPNSSWMNQLQAFAGVVGPQGGGSSSVILNESGVDAFGPDTFSVTPAETGGGNADLRRVQWNALEAWLDTGSFVLGPGQTATLSFSFNAFSFGRGDGFSAWVQAQPGGWLVWQPPPGVTLSAAVPLHWASAVPEPGGFLLWGLGLLGLAARARWPGGRAGGLATRSRPLEGQPPRNGR